MRRLYLLNRIGATRSGSVSHFHAGSFSTGTRPVFTDEKKLSIAALSQTLPERLIEQTTPLSAINRWNCSLLYTMAETRQRVKRLKDAGMGFIMIQGAPFLFQIATTEFLKGVREDFGLA